MLRFSKSSIVRLKIILLDEPLSGLDEENKNLFIKLFLKLYNNFL